MRLLAWRFMISKNKIKFLCSLKIKKYRDQHQKALLEGFRLIDESINFNARINNIWMEIGPLKPTQVNQFWLQIPTPIFFVSVVLAITLLIFNIVKLKKTPENEKEMKI